MRTPEDSLLDQTSTGQTSDNSPFKKRGGIYRDILDHVAALTEVHSLEALQQRYQQLCGSGKTEHGIMVARESTIRQIRYVLDARRMAGISLNAAEKEMIGPYYHADTSRKFLDFFEDSPSTTSEEIVEFFIDPFFEPIQQQFNTVKKLLAHLSMDDRKLVFAKVKEKKNMRALVLESIESERIDERMVFRVQGKLKEATHENNLKFAVGMSTAGAFYFLWNTGCHEHADIFTNAEKMLATDEKPITLEVRSGGYIRLVQKEEGIVVMLLGRSTNFGSYSKVFLEKYRTELEKAFKENLGVDTLTLIIRESI